MTHRDVFILGAGFSNAINAQMPTMKDLTLAVSEHINNSELSLPLPLEDAEDRGRAPGRTGSHPGVASVIQPTSS